MMNDKLFLVTADVTEYDGTGTISEIARDVRIVIAQDERSALADYDAFWSWKYEAGAKSFSPRVIAITGAIE